MNPPPFLTRRAFLATTGLAVAAIAATEAPVPAPKAAYRLCLSPGSIGVSASQTETIQLAARFSFEAVEPFPQALAGLPPGQMDLLLADLKAKHLVWGAAGLPVEFRRDDTAFNDGVQKLPGLAAAMGRAGVARVGTWLSPSSGTLTYVQNFRRHAERLRIVAKILADQGLSLGLEYVGTFTARANAKFPFAHCLAETRELIHEIGTGNVGLILDSWHWWQAGDTEADLRSLTPADIVSVDLNDAPAGIARNEQQDGRRELPAATGVIDVTAFLKALQQIGYAGPVRAEPFNKPLNDLDNDAACAATIAALQKARNLVAADGSPR
jgi:sugar phosphate isomerase/epimerase